MNNHNNLLMNYFAPSTNKLGFNKCVCVQPLKQTTLETFLVRAQPEEDIYHIYSSKEDNAFIGTALIPTFTTSVMLNRLFRNIKENDNLDALEESDDEDEFEIEDNCKHIFLDRVLKMKCEYNGKFKKWVPVRVSE